MCQADKVPEPLRGGRRHDRAPQGRYPLPPQHPQQWRLCRPDLPLHPGRQVGQGGAWWHAHQGWGRHQKKMLAWWWRAGGWPAEGPLGSWEGPATRWICASAIAKAIKGSCLAY